MFDMRHARVKFERVRASPALQDRHENAPRMANSLNSCRPENATVRAACLELLGKQLGPLKQKEAAGSLLPQVRHLSIYGQAVIGE